MVGIPITEQDEFLMKLVVFDIDGTLTETMSVDTECFVQAVRDILEVDPTGMDWNDFPHVTDDGVLEVLYRQAKQRPPSPEESAAFVNHFSEILDRARKRETHRFGEIPGAAAILAHLHEQPDWTIAMATGAWARTARMKLETAQIPDLNIPLATSDDHYTREEIVRTAVTRAKTATGLSQFDRIVSVGDGAWDVRTARNLGLPFVGIGTNEKLAAIEAPVGMPDYLNTAAVMTLLETAGVP